MAAEATPDSITRGWSRYEAAALGFRNYWYPALLSNRLKAKPAALRILGEEIVLARHEGSVYALRDRCPHRGLPLSRGRCEFPGTPTISCCYHGWTFDLRTGQLVAAITDGPTSPLVGKVCVPTYPTFEQNGIIWIYVGDDAAVPLSEDIPEVFLGQHVSIASRVTVRKGNWRLAAENGLDPVHATYLHRTAWVSTPLKFPAWRGKIVPSVEGKWVGYQDALVWECEYPGLGRFPHSRPWWKLIRFGAGNTIIVHLRLPGCLRVTNWPRLGTDHYEWYVPIDEHSYRYFQFKVRHVSGIRSLPFRVGYQILWRWLADRQFNDQDKFAVASMEDFYAHDEGWKNEFLFRQDAVLIRWRKFASENGRAVRESDVSVRRGAL